MTRSGFSDTLFNSNHSLTADALFTHIYTPFINIQKGSHLLCSYSAHRVSLTLLTPVERKSSVDHIIKQNNATYSYHRALSIQSENLAGMLCHISLHKSLENNINIQI